MQYFAIIEDRKEVLIIMAENTSFPVVQHDDDVREIIAAEDIRQ